MKKLNLDVDALAVDRFEIEPEAREAGTVVANQPLTLLQCTNTHYPQASCATGNPCRSCA